MGGLNIRLRIWLSIGIFVFGYMVSTLACELERLSSESHLRQISDALVPAAQSGHDATEAFVWLLDAYEDTFVEQDFSGPGRARTYQARVLQCLDAIAGSREVTGVRAATAARLALSMRQFVNEANVAYGQGLSGSDELPQELQDRVQRLAVQTKALKSDLGIFDRDLSGDVNASLHEVRKRSAQMRIFILMLFGTTLIVAVVLVNITIRRSIIVPLAKTQSELAHERDLLRILLDNIPDHIYFKDSESRFIRINKALASRFGLSSPEEAVGRRPADYFDPETAARIHQDDQMILASGQPNLSEFEQVTKPGVTRWMATSKVPVMNGSPSAPLIVGISRDITEWKKTMEELRRSEASFRLLFSAIPYPACVCDAETLRILEVNTAASFTYGYSVEEFHGMSIDDFSPADDRERLKRNLETLGPEDLPAAGWKHVAKDGRLLDVEIAMHLLEFHGRTTMLCLAQDVSERKRLELDLRHAQKLEAVGQLAAGIAHEINTPVQYVGDNLLFFKDAFHDRQALFQQYDRLLNAAVAGEISPELIVEVHAAREKADLEYIATEVPRAMEQSLDGVERIATIVRAMKAFAHPGSDTQMAADLNKALSDALIVARAEVKYVADVVTDFGDLPPVLCNLGDLNQVFLNLLVNAAHAIGDVVKKSGGRGEIRVTTRSENGQAIISISDTGCGIPVEIQSRVFEPFFTTKEVGKGTGQGLAISHNIVVEKHGGRLTFEPNLPRGTTFVVSLPIHGTRGANVESAKPLPEMATV
ncbi:MAG TPA: PAS domain S-box protein [Bryobacteraceae bacterium]|nr:PAS domain S-box protein [Bryobacteraceae bacterium]